MANPWSQDIIAGDLRGRIQAMNAKHGGHMPERVAIAWRAYVAALHEWGLLSTSNHDSLVSLVPPVTNDPTESLLRER